MCPITDPPSQLNKPPSTSPGQEGELVQTPLGPLPPQRSTDDLRRKEVLPVTYHANGMVRSLPLENQTVVSTPAGPMPAELVTFYPSGALKRVFPLNGRLSGYWTQEDEAGLAKPLSINTPQGVWRVLLISACFHENGSLRNLALWPEQSLPLSTPLGKTETRMGVSFWPNGEVHALEPATPWPVATPIGEVIAFDPDAVGISGDGGSLAFAPGGNLQRVNTVQSCVHIREPEGGERVVNPAWRESLCGFEEREPVPLRLEFTPEALILRQSIDAAPVTLPLERCRAMARPLSLNPFPKMSCGL